MKRLFCALAFCLLCLQTAHSREGNMRVGGFTAQPVGHYEFCKMYREECQPTKAVSPIKMTGKIWRLLNRVNSNVNNDIFAMSDLENVGVEELWSYPENNGYGDCEDYALLKRDMLITSGIPESNLLITVVMQPSGEGHAVLTVVTDRGDFVLDNLVPRIVLWDQTEYQFIKRQARGHAGRWVSILPVSSEVVSAVLKRSDVSPKEIPFSMVTPVQGPIPSVRPEF